MATKTQNSKSKTKLAPTAKPPAPAKAVTPLSEIGAAAPREGRHLLRRWLSAGIGFFAVWLILASILFGWFNYTLINDKQYLATVGPLASQPKIQTYISKTTADNIVNNATPQDLASKLGVKLPAQLPDDALRQQLTPTVQADVAKVIYSPAFANLWRGANQSVHDQLVSLIKSDAAQGTLDLKPTVDQLINLLKQTPLNFIDLSDVSSTNAQVKISPAQLNQLGKTYHASQNGLKALIVLAILASAASIFIANHRLKALRHLAIWTSVGLILIIVIASLPSHLQLNNIDPAAKDATVAAIQTIAHSLIKLCWICLIIGVLVIAGTTGWLWRQGHQVAKS